MRAEGAEVADRLDQIGLALAVAADEEVRPRHELDLGALVVAEVGEAEVGDDHVSRVQALRTAWPPNCLRSAATAFIDGRVLLARDEAGEDRRADRRDRNRVVERLFDGPPAFAGVLDVAFDVLELGVLLERLDEQLEQPGLRRRFRAARP